MIVTFFIGKGWVCQTIPSFMTHNKNLRKVNLVQQNAVQYKLLSLFKDDTTFDILFVSISININ